MRLQSWRFGATALIVAAAIQATALGQDAKPEKESKQPAQKKGANGPFPDVVAGVKATPGCLGVETARTSSGKNLVIAWFENKQAVLNWYRSAAHQEAMQRGFPDAQYRKPLKDVPNDTGPIMVIASITMAKESKFKSTTMPISQIAIELYQPLPGGAFLGARFAPASVKVPNMRDYTDEK
jgi:hypothetical protein